MHINLKGQLAVIAIIIFAGVCETKAVGPETAILTLANSRSEYRPVD